MSGTKPVVIVCDGCWRAWDQLSSDHHVSEGWGSLDAFLTKTGLGPNDYELSYGYCEKCAAALVQIYHEARAAVGIHINTPSARL